MENKLFAMNITPSNKANVIKIQQNYSTVKNEFETSYTNPFSKAVRSITPTA